MREIILASKSSRRRRILEMLGIDFRVVQSRFEEDNPTGLTPVQLVRYLAEQKVAAVSTRFPHNLVIGADTLVVVGRKLLGKPKDEQEAEEMLQLLSNREHVVFTGLVVADGLTGKKVGRVVKTKVYFRKLSSAEIKAYVATKEPLGKAGSYSIAGRGALLIERIEGDYFAILGLPVCTLGEVLREFGVDILS